MQEIMVVAAIALAILFLPRLMGRKSAPTPERNSIRLMPALTGWMRLAILVTIFWIAGSAAFLQPWENNTILFFYIALGPLIIGWGIFWVWSGYKKDRR
jgi:hypothetical protein